VAVDIPYSLALALIVICGTAVIVVYPLNLALADLVNVQEALRLLTALTVAAFALYT